MRTAAWLIGASVLWCTVPPLEAQTVAGQAEWAIDRYTADFGGARSFSRLFSQRYTVGYESLLWDRRFMTYFGELTFFRDGQRIDDERTSAHDFGYRLGANLFPARPFPLTINALRTSGSYSALTGGGLQSSVVPLPPGYLPDRFDSKLSSLEIGWQLNAPALPRFSIGYRSSSATTSTGPYSATQDDRVLDLSAAKDWKHVRNLLTFNSLSTDTVNVRPLTRRQRELLYSLWADAGPKLRATARAGYRDLASNFAAQPLTPGQGAPIDIPLVGSDLETRYVAGSVSYLPTRRLALDVSVGLDDAEATSGRSAGGTPEAASLGTSSLTATGNARYEILTGLSANALASLADLEERIGETTRSGLQHVAGGGLQYVVPLPHVQPMVGIVRTVGRIETVDGVSGNTGSWTRRAGLTANAGRAFGASAEFEDTEVVDDIFVLANYSRRRLRATVQAAPGRRIQLDASWEDSDVNQGRDLLVLDNRVRTTQGGVTWLVARGQQVLVRGGQWRTATRGDDIDSRVITAQYQATFSRLRAQAEYSREAFDGARLGQAEPVTQYNNRVQGYIEYQLRLFTLGFDFRHARSAQGLLPGAEISQWRVRVIRRFGSTLR